MYSRIVVPVDGSELSWIAVGPARQLAERWGADLELISIVHFGNQVEPVTDDIETRLVAAGWQDDTIVTVLESRVEQVADIVADHAERHPGSLVVMTSHGRGRSAALFGSVAERLLRQIGEPVLVFGPAAADSDHTGFEGRMLVCVDGSSTSEAALDVAASWLGELNLEPWVVAVAGEVPVTIGGELVVESAYPHRMADRLGEATGREVEFETLHGKDPARAVADFAAAYQGALVVAATHGRTGLDRLTEGSVAMSIVRHAPCPVLLIGPREGEPEDQR